jgi:hypothetical protein
MQNAVIINLLFPSKGIVQASTSRFIKSGVQINFYGIKLTEFKRRISFPIIQTYLPFNKILFPKMVVNLWDMNHIAWKNNLPLCRMDHMFWKNVLPLCRMNYMFSKNVLPLCRMDYIFSKNVLPLCRKNYIFSKNVLTLCQQNYILWKYVVTIRGIMGNIMGKNHRNKLKTNLSYTKWHAH